VSVIFFSNFVTLVQPIHGQEDTSFQTSDTGQAQTTNDDNEKEGFILFLIILGIIYSIYEKFTKRYGKHRERRYFPASVKEDTSSLKLVITNFGP
jgi:hypothetical protein